MIKISKIKEVQQIGQKLKGNYGGDITEITYQLPSENPKKYSPKLELINSEFESAWDNIIKEFLETVKTKKGKGFVYIPAIIDKASAEAKYGAGNWKVKAWEYFDAVNKNLDELNALISKRNALRSKKGQQTLLVIKSVHKSRDALIKNTQIFQDILERNNRFFYEKKILELLVKRIGNMRQDFSDIFAESGAGSLKDAIYILAGSSVKDVTDQLYKVFTTSLKGINMYMRLYYLFWVADPIYIAKSKVSKNLASKINDLRDRYETELNFIQDEIKNKKTSYMSKYPKWIQSLLIDTGFYDEIMSLWLQLEENTLIFLKDSLNAEDLMVKIKASRKKDVNENNATELISSRAEYVKPAKEIEVHWFSNLAQNKFKVKHAKWQATKSVYDDYYSPYPYKKEKQLIKIADNYIKYFVSNRSCLLCHEINDDYDATKKPTDDNFEYEYVDAKGVKTKYYGWEGYYYVSFTILNLVSNNSPQTTHKLKNILNSGIEEKLMEINDTLTLEIGKAQKKATTPTFLLNSLRTQTEAYQDLMTKNEDWFNDYDDTKTANIEAVMKSIGSKFRKMKEYIFGMEESMESELVLSGSFKREGYLAKFPQIETRIVFGEIIKAINNFYVDPSDSIKIFSNNMQKLKETVKGRDQPIYKSITKEFTEEFEKMERILATNKTEFINLKDKKNKTDLKPIKENISTQAISMINSTKDFTILTEKRKLKKDINVSELTEKQPALLEEGIQEAEKQIQEAEKEKRVPIGAPTEAEMKEYLKIALKSKEEKKKEEKEETKEPTKEKAKRTKTK